MTEAWGRGVGGVAGFIMGMCETCKCIYKTGCYCKLATVFKKYIERES